MQTIWSLKLNFKKCSVLDFGAAIRQPFPCNYTLDNVPIPVNTSYKDLNIIASNNLNFSSNRNRKVNIAHARSNLILRAFPFSDIPAHCKLFALMLDLFLEYCSPIWSSSYAQKNIGLIENVLRSFTRCLLGLSYLERLFVTNLPSLEIRRSRSLTL